MRFTNLLFLLGLLVAFLLALIPPTFKTVLANGNPDAPIGIAASGITDPNLVLTPAPLSLQPVGTPFVDPVFGTTLRRVSNTSDSGGFETQEYSQLQAFSSDNAYILLDGTNGFVVRRMSNFSLVTGLDTSNWNAPRWYSPQAHTLIHFDGNDDQTIRVQLTNVDTLTTTTIYTFPSQYQTIIVARSFDELSEDGRWLAGVAQRNDSAWVIFTLDLQNLTLEAQVSIPDLYVGLCAPDPTWGQVPPDWVGVSPLGRYLVVQWVRDGTARCSGLETFDLQTGDFVGRVYDSHQHGDLGVDADGITEFFMTFEMYHPSGNMWLGLRHLPGTSTVSPPIYVRELDWFNGEHISCPGPNGVCLVTAGGDPALGIQPFEEELFLQYTNGQVLRLVHHRSSRCGYWVQPRATISHDGQYVVFASDWGRQLDCADLGRGDPYILELAGGFTLTTNPSTQAIDPSDVATYTISLSGAFSGTVSLLAASPSPSLTLGLTPTSFTQPGQATLILTDTHSPGSLSSGLWYSIPLTATGDGLTRTASVNLLVGGARAYLPMILK